jgi:hypothetical protein
MKINSNYKFNIVFGFITPISLSMLGLLFPPLSQLFQLIHDLITKTLLTTETIGPENIGQAYIASIPFFGLNVLRAKFLRDLRTECAYVGYYAFLCFLIGVSLALLLILLLVHLPLTLVGLNMG